MSTRSTTTTILSGHTVFSEARDNEEFEKKTPEFMNPEVFATVMKAIGEISSETKAIDRYGKVNWFP